MLYLSALISLSVILYFLARASLDRKRLKQEAECRLRESAYAKSLEENARLQEDNLALGDKAVRTAALYDISKDISKTLDENKVFGIFKERVRNYVKAGDYKFLAAGSDLKKYPEYRNFPLVIGDVTAGYLLAGDTSGEDQGKLEVLAKQFLIVMKRVFLYKKIQELAITDGLTQVFSRRHFLERFAEEFRRSRKFKHSLSFLMADIDRFKGFNDKYGHLVGDAILRQAAKTIKESVRQIDFVGRYGGEELSVVLAETDKDQAFLAAERIRLAIESMDIKVYDEELRATISIGVSTFPDDAQDAGALIEAADRALYSAKDSGRNKTCVYPDVSKPRP